MTMRTRTLTRWMAARGRGHGDGMTRWSPCTALEQGLEGDQRDSELKELQCQALSLDRAD
jgi:hypothetical protein